MVSGIGGGAGTAEVTSGGPAVGPTVGFGTAAPGTEVVGTGVFPMCKKDAVLIKAEYTLVLQSKTA